MALDPATYFIIVPNMLGNGLSSSPSNTPPPHDRARFPRVDVLRQRARCSTGWSPSSSASRSSSLVTGWSMGAGQTYQWAVAHPDMVPRILPFCGVGADAAAQHRVPRGRQGGADRGRGLERRLVREQPGKGLRAMARVYAGWGFSRPSTWRSSTPRWATRSLEDFLVGFWEGFFLDERDAEQPADHAADLAARRHRRRRRGSTASREGARRDPGAGDRHAGREGPLLPARGQRVRGRRTCRTRSCA